VKPTILLVEDNPVTTKLVRFALERKGYEVLGAGTGRMALKVLESTRVDLVLQDLVLPDVDGFELAAQLRARLNAPHVPLLAFTGLLSQLDESRIAAVGFDDVVVKPIEPSRLVQIVKAFLASASLQADVEEDENDPLLDEDGADATGDRDSGVLIASSARNGVALPRQHARSPVYQRLQVGSGLAQRCALLASQLSVITGISDALSRGKNFVASLDNVLASFFDAGGISTGALLLFEREGSDVHAFGLAKRWEKEMLGSFFGELDVLRTLLLKGGLLDLPLEQGELSRAWEAMKAAGFPSALVVPIQHGDQLLGALLISSDGTPVANEERASFAVGVAGQISQGVALARAFAAKSAAEQEARTNATALKAMMEAISDGVIVVDTNGKFIFWNTAADPYRRSHGSEATVFHDTWPNNYGPFYSDGLTRYSVQDLPLARAIRGETVDNVEIFLRHAEAPEGIRVSVNARPLMLDGQRRGGVVTFRDVSLERAAQEQLMVSDRMASIGTLAAGVAHEINNPLTSVVANLGLAVAGARELESAVGGSPLLTEIRECLGEAREATNRVRFIVKDLKLFSRAEEDHRGPVDVERVLESTLRMASNEIRHRARVVKEYGIVPMVDANEARLGQVFLNLVVNAAQAMPEGHADTNAIHVLTATDETGRVVVEVRDTGSGMGPEALAKVFDPFFTTKPAGIGTGLGLAICHRIVAGFGGEITVESKVGVGTTFRVVLPVAKGGPTVQTVRRSTEAAGRRGKILVIDDDPNVGTVIHRLLALEHDVKLVSSADEALVAIAAGEHFDVILCDVMMPVVTGMDFFYRLDVEKKEQAERVVFLTGGVFSERASKFLEAIPKGRLLEKPFDSDDLKALVNERVRRG
jgi:signal transduction histidine kinase/DNA-binding response OmpR family regulator